MTVEDVVETVVIGAGVIGLAIARALARDGREVVIVEAEDSIGSHTSSRNSEVIHAGLYYPPTSLKAQMCVEGRALLYRYLEDEGIDHRRCGKLVVACDEAQRRTLAEIEANAIASGVSSLQRMNRAEIERRAPAIRAIEALWSPDSGIVDSHGLMRHLLADVREAGGSLALATRVCAVSPGTKPARFVIETADFKLGCRHLINAGGLGAHALAHRITHLAERFVPTLYLAKGTYFRASSAPPLSCLVYPVPASASLGIHATIDLAGEVRWGPDQEWIDDISYHVDEHRAAACEQAVRQFVDLPPETTFSPTYAGIRPKLQAPGSPRRDFMIQDERSHGLAGLVNLFGMESPGLTACLAIANYVRGLVSATP